MADDVGQIAFKTNMLALNAAIEAVNSTLNNLTQRNEEVFSQESAAHKFSCTQPTIFASSARARAIISPCRLRTLLTS